jgi:hypothetical protein
MKARTGMLLGSLLLLSAIAQANEPMPTKPSAIKLAAELKLDNAHPAVQQVIRAAAEGAHLACENNVTTDPPVDRNRAAAGKSAKSTPAAPKRSRRLGCDSFHCVARGDALPASEASSSRPAA